MLKNTHLSVNTGSNAQKIVNAMGWYWISERTSSAVQKITLFDLNVIHDYGGQKSHAWLTYLVISWSFLGFLLKIFPPPPR